LVALKAGLVQDGIIAPLKDYSNGSVMTKMVAGQIMRNLLRCKNANMSRHALIKRKMAMRRALIAVATSAFPVLVARMG
jgi:hypothetical protein